ncbi:MAG: tetratricopeptide repeat protein [bacterium]|nr:tetratricopeptide repeat protein [bacterium]
MDLQELLGDAQRHFLKGDYEASIKKFAQALEAGADAFMVYLSRGVAYLRMEEMERAIEEFGKAIEKNPANMRGYYYRGVIYLSKDDYQRALSDLNRVIELQPDHGPAHLARGTLYGLIGEDEKSAMDMKTAIIQSESQIQGVSDTLGLLRTQFHKAMAQMTGESEGVAVSLTEDEIDQVKKWVDEG